MAQHIQRRPTDDIPNPLYYAALCGFRGLVEHLVADYPQLVNAIGGGFGSPLLAALSKNHIWIAEFLLQHGGKVDVREMGENTPLNNAVAMFQEHAVPFLLKHGADVNSQGISLYTPLHYAASYAYLEVSQMLLDRGADVNSRDNQGKTPLHWLFEDAPCFGTLSRVPHVARLLLEHGANVNAQDDEHTLPLLQVLEPEEGENLHLDDIAQMLLEYGAEPNVKNKDGKTPLQIVLGRKYYSKDNDAQDLVTARLLVEHGADVNAQDKGHTPPLLLAFQRNMYEMTRVLLSRGADPNVKNDSGKAALHLLLEGDFSYEDDVPGLVRLLLDCGIDVDAQDEDHATPLLLAVDRHLDDIAQICLERGAEPNVKNNKGKTPLHLLLERKWHENDNVNNVLAVERLLLECGADVNAQDEHGITPLHLASHHERLEIAQILLGRSNAETIGIELQCAKHRRNAAQTRTCRKRTTVRPDNPLTLLYNFYWGAARTSTQRQ
ncbi:Ankyrin repeat-containing domain protein [Lactarius tabidus]